MHPMGWMWGAWGVGMMLMMLVFWGLIVTGIVLGIRWLARQGRDSSLGRVDLDQILCLEEHRVVGRDNVVTAGLVPLQLAKQPGRRTCAGLRVLVRRHLNGHHSVWYGSRCLGHFTPHGQPRRAA